MRGAGRGRGGIFQDVPVSIPSCVGLTRLTNYGCVAALSFPPPIRSKAGYGGKPGRKTLLWIPVPRLREDKLHGNDTKRVSPTVFILNHPCLFSTSRLNTRN